jgi:pilus assembly protein Flp/PilA
MSRMLLRLIADETGQDLIEYALLAALITTVSITALSLLGTQVPKLFTRVMEAFPPA